MIEKMYNEQNWISIFFAIPCGDFFSVLNQIIRDVCQVANIEPIIVEDHSKTAGLWEKITNGIDSADYFVADISSRSPNVILELGYAIREKKSKYVAIFIADNIPVPVDLQGFTLQKYTSFRDFQEKLIKWISDNIRFVDKGNFDSLKSTSPDFHEDFKDYDRFLKLWSFPPQCSFQLTHEGLRFTNAHFPILTTTLALLRDYEFEFRARIQSGNVGWVVKGTRPFDRYLLAFCIMFNLDQNGRLTPHIFNVNKVVTDPPTLYKVFNSRTVEVNFSRQGWFKMITRVEDDKVTIINEGNTIFEQDFTMKPFREFYEFPNKQGEVGFRCHPGEQGIINYVKVRELTI